MFILNNWASNSRFIFCYHTLLQVKNLVKNLATWRIKLDDIKWATGNFADTYCIKSHDQLDDILYKAELSYKPERPKEAVVIKRIINHKYWKATDFYAELELLAGCKHDNLVPLLGFCNEESEKILVFECSFNETLDDNLGSTSNLTHLTWEQRIRICLDIARGLEHLHSNELKQSHGMIHQGILSANVTLKWDGKWKAKIANFRDSKFSSCSYLWRSRLENFRAWLWMKTYQDPPEPGKPSAQRHDREDIYSFLALRHLRDDIYSPSGQRSVLDDIYSFGVILFEILTGTLAYDPRYMSDNRNVFAFMAHKHFNEGKLKNITDPRLMEEDQKCCYAQRKGPVEYSLDAYFKIAYQCLGTPRKRPTLEAVIKSLDKALHFQVSKILKLEILCSLS
ncbi:putative receptor-like protein kinase At5g24010 [Bidens hawaiensis]|uniref:putative receptor-like protein kinase At5g24010 n=1 Tax=Bidens hawaiensis TaxID=980011 RepID=UPI00404B42A1